MSHLPEGIHRPPKPDAPPHAALAAAKPGQSKLSIGHSLSQRSAAPPPLPPQEVLFQRQLAQAKASHKGSAMKWITISVVVIGLGVAGYFGYGYFSEWQAKRSEAAKQASAPPPATNAVPAEPPPPKELPVLPAVWTLDVDKANIPEGKANGTLGGTNFMVETAVCVPQLLRLYQGLAASPDRELQIFLHLNPSDSLSGRSWTIKPQDLAGKAVPQIVKRWKTNPLSAPRSTTFSSGYAMRLELGDVETNTITGKIFLALPDPEQSVVAGLFKAATGPVTTASAPAPAGAPLAAPPASQRSAADRRYGGKR